MTYAFHFDARFCSGCKACQAACKDKNNLPPGVLWRRVVEVTGGTWQPKGDAWNHTVFAYNLSLSCNHCMHPKCAGVCPTKAYTLREDGIVFLDTEKCMGCGYCSWVCPYSAPQYNPETGRMTKCDLCIDQLEQGCPPACVAACPMRVLDYGDLTTEKGIALWNVPSETHPYPLPSFSHTQPRLAVKPHPAMSIAEPKYVANQEEIQPRVPSRWEDVPLMLFTLLAQLAVGGFWAMWWMFSPSGSLVPTLLIGACLGVGMLASVAHLGTKKNARYAFRNLRKSSLSKEIFFAGLFGLGWLFTALESLLWRRSTFEAMAVTSIFGMGLIYNMSQVYRFPAAPGWNSWRTNASFMISALLLGHSVMLPTLAYEASMAGLPILFTPSVVTNGMIILLLLAQLLLMREQLSRNRLQDIRVGFISIGIMVSIASFFSLDTPWISIFILLVILVEETLGRWIFYRSRV